MTNSEAIIAHLQKQNAELLEALKALLNCSAIRETGTCGQCEAQARAVITKVEKG